MPGVLNDIRFAARSLLKRRAVSVVAVLSLGVGVGVTTTAFSLLNALMLRDLPGIVEEDGLVTLALALESPTGWSGPSMLAWPDVERLREWDDVFSGVAAAGPADVAVLVGDEPRVERAEVVSTDYFTLLGTRPYMGRLLTESDGVPGTGSVVLAHRFYEALGEPADVVGRTVFVNGREMIVVGVAPPRFTGMVPGDLVEGERSSPSMWISLAESGTVRPAGIGAAPLSIDARWLRVVARRHDAVTTQRLEAALPQVARSLERAEPQLRKGARLEHGGLRFGPGAGSHRLTIMFMAFMIVPMLVLLIACANAANLLLARTAERSRELSIRAALGANRRTLMRGILAESLLIALAAGILGLLVALWSRDIAALYAVRLSMAAPLDLRVFAFALATAVGAGVLLGLLPALRASRPALSGTLSGADRTTGTRGAARLRRALVVAQVTLSVVLLVVAGLFVRSAGYGLSVPSGLNEEGLTVVTLDLDILGYEAVRGRAFQQELVRETQRLPGVEAAALADRPPLAGRSSGRVAGAGEELEHGRPAGISEVGDGYFAAAGVDLLAGRPPRAGVGGEVAISRAVAESLWPEASPLGQRMSLEAGEERRIVEVVGLTENSRSVLYRTPEPVVYTPLPDRYSPSVTLLVRSGSPDQTVRGVRELVRRMDPHLPVHSIETARELRNRQLLPLRLLALALATMGTIAVGLAVAGLYGVMAFNVTRRTREIGVRLAFGARRGQILTLVLGEAVRLVAAGVILGGVIAAGLALLMRSLLFGVSPVDPITYGSLAALLLGVGALAALLPALRAASVEPVRAIGE